jgi:Tfp pilus assembly protein PilF
LRRAEGEFKEAIAADPAYAPAYAALAEVYGRLYFMETVSAEESLVPARPAAATALKLDPRLAASHEAAALVGLIDWDWAGAEREYQLAIDLDPQQVRTRQAYAQLYLGPAGRYREANDQLEQALQVDPVDINLITELGVNYRQLGKLEPARAQLQRSLELNPTAMGTRTEIIILDELTGQYATAAQKMDAVYADGPDDPWVMGHYGYACARAGRTADALRVLQALKTTSRAAMHIAAVYAGLGNNDEALGWLERGVASRSPSMFWLRSDFRFAALRSHPRFQKLLPSLPR